MSNTEHENITEGRSVNVYRYGPGENAPSCNWCYNDADAMFEYDADPDEDQKNGLQLALCNDCRANLRVVEVMMDV